MATAGRAAVTTIKAAADLLLNHSAGGAAVMPLPQTQVAVSTEPTCEVDIEQSGQASAQQVCTPLDSEAEARPLHASPVSQPIACTSMFELLGWLHGAIVIVCHGAMVIGTM